MNKTLKDYNLIKVREFFEIPDFIVIDIEFIKDCLKKDKLDKKIKQILNDKLKDNTIRDFILNKKNFIARSSTNLDSRYPGLFDSVRFKGIKDFHKAIKKIRHSYFRERMFLIDNFNCSVIIQKYIDGIKGNFYFDKKGNFYLEFFYRKETIYISIFNNNSYFSDFYFFMKYTPHIGIFYRKCMDVLKNFNYKKISGEIVLRDDNIYLIQLNNWDVPLPDFNFYVEFENKYNYSFHPSDFDLKYFKFILSSIGFSKEIKFKVSDIKILLNFSDILDMDLFLKSNIEDAVYKFYKVGLNFIAEEYRKIDKLNEFYDVISGLKEFYGRFSILNFFYTRMINYYTVCLLNRLGKKELLEKAQKYEFFNRFIYLKNRLKNFYNEITGLCYKKMKDIDGKINEEKLKIACSMDIKKSFKYLSGKLNYSERKERNFGFKKVLFKFPVEGISLSDGNATGYIRIIKNYDEVEKIKSNEIVVSNYFDYGLSKSVVKARAAITSVGGYFSHIAVISRTYRKPCVGGIWGCERIFKDGEKIEIKEGIIYKR